MRRDAAFIAACQGSDGGWEQQSILTLAAMLGLGPAHPAFDRGLQFLRRIVREDGGIPFIPDLGTWFNALAVLAFQAGRSSPTVRLEALQFLAIRQHDNGAWSFTDGVQQTDSDCTAICVEALLREDLPSHRPVVERALAHFGRMQREDGGYPTYEREGESEPTITANILLDQCLAVHRHPELRRSMADARRFLRARQRRDGRFETSWSLCETYSIFRVMSALEAHRTVDPEHPRDPVCERALNYLVEHQQSDGGWGQTATSSSDALSTAYALSALSLPRFTAAVSPACRLRAAGFLLSTQDPRSGAFLSIPDQAGPRPIPYDVPSLCTVMCVLALSRALEGL
ncbi:prenyltransferase/squalene oxidase repeat-containing protein [Nannocystis pusilla]|uniref:prenyltransferase/squalene oxidase repeat-containing protein n=1 Tax=Nannocystis pusilla TaxID=889268 RepID=UPI003B7F6FFC